MNKRLPKHYAIHIFTLLAIAVTHPIFDLLVTGDHATFFVAHQAESTDIWSLILLLTVILPLTITFGTWALNRLSARLSICFLGLIFLFTATSLFSMLAKHYFPDTGYAVILVLLCGLICTLLYTFSETAQLFVTLMSPAILLVPLLFVANSTIKALLIEPEIPGDQPLASHSSSPNIVIIVFDELPLLSLLDENRMIDSGRYPNFFKLAATSTWYRNATTIHYATRYSIPSILTGTDHWERFGRLNVNRPKIMLALESFPENVFSLFETSHQTYALLSTTTIGGSQDPGTYTPPLKERFPYLLADLSILYAHLVVPKHMTERLPQIYGQWEDFTGKQNAQTADLAWPYKGGKPGRIKQLIDSFHKSDVPGLYVAHVVLPHHPFRYNERGQLHEDKSHIADDGVKFPRGIDLWPDEALANTSYQAHLLQLGFVDRLLGNVIDRLKSLDMFQDSLIIVTADHGISFYWNRENLPQAKLYAVQASEVLYIPLLIKAPGQTQPEISGKVAQTIDILPTLADMLDVSIPWDVDGVSLLDERASTSNRFAWFMYGKKQFDSDIDPQFLALKRKIDLFGSGDYEPLYNFGPHKSMVNTIVADWEEIKSDATVKIFNKDVFLDVDPLAFEVPAYIEGEILIGSRPTKSHQLILAATVNGVIKSTYQASIGEGNPHFLFRISPASFVKGVNEISVYGIIEDQLGKPVGLEHFNQD
ncbi:sulfatase-like hydrolase/transferase [Pseudomonadota bacterium]